MILLGSVVRICEHTVKYSSSSSFLSIIRTVLALFWLLCAAVHFRPIIPLWFVQTSFSMIVVFKSIVICLNPDLLGDFLDRNLEFSGDYSTISGKRRMSQHALCHLVRYYAVKRASSTAQASIISPSVTFQRPQHAVGGILVRVQLGFL
jgi:hypothetical protein